MFITQDAKLRLEKAGCILFKDASANKGGVTSSSLEVLASLSFDDEGFLENMCVHKDGSSPPFYEAYVLEVQSIIKRNAELEFEAIWREHEETKLPRSALSDTLSVAITKLDEELQNSDLWRNVELRRSVLEDALPNLLLKKIGLDTIIERVSANKTCKDAMLISTGTGQISALHLWKLPCKSFCVRAWKQSKPICLF